MCAWSVNLTNLILSGDPIERSFKLEVRNGYQAYLDGPWTEIPLMEDGWSLTHTDANPIIGSARFKIVMKDFEYMDEFDHNNPVQEGSAVRFSCTVVNVTGGPETEFLYRGIIDNIQKIDMGLLVEALDPMDKLQRRLSPILEVADIFGPTANVLLDHAPNWDAPATFHTYECDRIVPNAWAFVNLAIVIGKRRVWVAGIFEVQREDPVGSANWVHVSVDEYIVDEPNGLIHFHNTQGPAIVSVFRLTSLSVYLEGTLDLAYVIEQILEQPMSFDPDCADLGCGFTNAELRIPLTGTWRFTYGWDVVNGIGTDFTNELCEGDRVAHDLDTEHYIIVDQIISPVQFIGRYMWWSPTTLVQGGYKSTLRASGVDLSNIQWATCDGIASELFRKLQEYYADIRGYKIWYDYENERVIGDRVAIDLVTPTDLGPVTRLATRSTLENFNTAVRVGGTVGRAVNLAKAPGTTFNLEILGYPPPNDWALGSSSGGGIGDLGMLWHLFDPPAMNTVYDGDYDWVLMAYRNDWAAHTQWWNFFTVDLGAVWSLSEVHYYNVAARNTNPNADKCFLRILGRAAVTDPWKELTPELWDYLLEWDEHAIFDVTNSLPVRYILVSMRPGKWVVSDQERTLGCREFLLFGSQDICTGACIQGTVNPGPPPHTEGIGGHFIGGGGGVVPPSENDWITDYYPDLVKKMTNTGHRVLRDDQDLIFTEMQALDRAYILLDEVIRLYRAVGFHSHFDPRVRVYDTARVLDDYRTGVPEALYFLVQKITMSETGVVISGTEYGAGVLE